MLRRRARFIDAIRGFFRERDVLEVDTPLLASCGATDPHLDSITASYHAAPGQAPGQLYLQTSPEFAMKRLLANGCGPIFQLGHCFRDGERGRRHNPEFTMLEWYRPGFALSELMTEVADLVQDVAGVHLGEHLTYREAFQRHADVDPFLATDAELAVLACALSGLSAAGMERDDALDIILSHRVEPRLGLDGATFLYHYPPSQAALARIREEEDGTRVAQRFELYIKGLEIANGYFELTDATEQADRFAADNERRRALGKPEVPVDARLLAALASGLPSCAGVALGVDRLLMIAAGVDSIDAVLAFPIDRI